MKNKPLRVISTAVAFSSMLIAMSLNMPTVKAGCAADTCEHPDTQCYDENEDPGWCKFLSCLHAGCQGSLPGKACNYCDVYTQGE